MAHKTMTTTRDRKRISLTEDDKVVIATDELMALIEEHQKVREVLQTLPTQPAAPRAGPASMAQ